jgi:hypothetical protein
MTYGQCQVQWSITDAEMRQRHLGVWKRDGSEQWRSLKKFYGRARLEERPKKLFLTVRRHWQLLKKNCTHGCWNLQNWKYFSVNNPPSCQINWEFREERKYMSMEIGEDLALDSILACLPDRGSSAGGRTYSVSLEAHGYGWGRGTALLCC